jgi:hypothetical protein
MKKMTENKPNKRGKIAVAIVGAGFVAGLGGLLALYGIDMGYSRREIEKQAKSLVENRPFLKEEPPYDPNVMSWNLHRERVEGNVGIQQKCESALLSSGIEYSILMHKAGYEFTPGGGYWFRIRKGPPNEEEKRWLGEASEVDKRRIKMNEQCERYKRNSKPIF